jgi:hypothetical protein
VAERERERDRERERKGGRKERRKEGRKEGRKNRIPGNWMSNREGEALCARGYLLKVIKHTMERGLLCEPK